MPNCLTLNSKLFNINCSTIKPVYKILLPIKSVIIFMIYQFIAYISNIFISGLQLWDSKLFGFFFKFVKYSGKNSCPYEDLFYVNNFILQIILLLCYKICFIWAKILWNSSMIFFFVFIRLFKFLFFLLSCNRGLTQSFSLSCNCLNTHIIA